MDPRRILEDGVRKEVVRLLSIALHNNTLYAQSLLKRDILGQVGSLGSAIEGLRKSVQYIQDYIDMPGLKIFQEEFTRLINYNTEQEANRYLKRKTFDSNSRYQSRAIPIPRYTAVGAGHDSQCINFCGRLVAALEHLTDPTTTVYVAESSAWFFHPAPDYKVHPYIT